MRTKKTGLIGVITEAITSVSMTPDSAGLPAVNLLKGIQTVMDQSEMLMMVADIGANSANFLKLTKTFREHRVEGILFVADYHQEFNPPTAFFEIPTVLVNCFDKQQRLPAVVPDDSEGGYLAAEAALSKGHQRIGLLTLPETIVASKQRKIGYFRAHKERGIPVDPDLISSIGDVGDSPDVEQQTLKNVLQVLIKLESPPTAICCGNDKMAMNVYMLLQQWDISIPEQISIIGFDDYTLISELLNPRLTTVQLPYVEIGEAAAALLIEEIKRAVGAKEPTKMISQLIGPVIWRHSVKNLL
jgi:LacI family transcriptional regulator